MDSKIKSMLLKRSDVRSRAPLWSFQFDFFVSGLHADITSMFSGSHDAQDGMTVQILQREVDKMGLRID